MRRTKVWAGLSALLLGASLLATAPAAQADYHGFCANGEAFDALFFTREGTSELRFRGYVQCTGEDITIHHLRVTPAGGATTSLGPVTCTDLCDLSGLIPAEVNRFEVAMAFTIGDHPHPAPRKAHFVYLGAGNPIRTCPVTGFNAPFNGCV